MDFSEEFDFSNQQEKIREEHESIYTDQPFNLNISEIIQIKD
jgi:hypothetical protein